MNWIKFDKNSELPKEGIYFTISEEGSFGCNKYRKEYKHHWYDDQNDAGYITYYCSPEYPKNYK